jgi:hypothetical protein
MSILHLKTNTLIQQRMTPVGGSKQIFSTVTSVSGNLQPLSIQDSQLYDGVYGRTFQFFTDGTVDIQEGDRFRDEAGAFYRCKGGGVVRRTEGSIDYLKVVVERI